MEVLRYRWTPVRFQSHTKYQVDPGLTSIEHGNTANAGVARMRLLLVLVQWVGEGKCRHFVALEEEIGNNKQWQFGESQMIKSRFYDEKIITFELTSNMNSIIGFLNRKYITSSVPKKKRISVECFLLKNHQIYA